MGIVTSRRSSGLIVAEHGADGAAVRRALKQHDHQLELLPPGVDTGDGAERWHWRVYARVGDRLVHVLSWVDEHNQPLPLSMRLVDEVQRHDRNTRGDLVSADEHNRRLREERRRDYLRDMEERIREFGPRLDGKKSSPPPRSVGLRMARDKARARQRIPELRP